MRIFAWTAGTTLLVLVVLVAAGALLSRRGAGSATGLPSPWQSVDVGSPDAAGSASFRDGVFTVSGAGADVWLAADQFHYVHRPLTGNGEIIARVTSQTNTHGWAKAGVMVKESTKAGSRYVAMVVTPGHGFVFQYYYNGEVKSEAYSFPDAWVRLVRSGATITGYISANGTDWTRVGPADVSMPAKVTAGLLVTSHDPVATSTATFDNVTLVQQ